MESSLRPWFTTGVALVGVGAVAIAPTTLYVPEKPAAVAISAPTPTVLTDVQLTTLEWPYLLSLPIVRARIGSWLEEWSVFLGGWARSGIGLAESVIGIPGVTVEIIQQIFELDFVGALNTFTTAVRDAVAAVGDPLVQSWVWRGQKAYDQRSALIAAYPRAIIDVTNGVLDATGVVVDQALTGTREFIAAVLTFDLGNIITAAVDGIGELVGAVGDGARLIVDGIESAQLAIATAWQAGPPRPFSGAPSSAVPAAGAVPDLGATVVSLSTGRVGSAAAESDVPAVDAAADSDDADVVAVEGSEPETDPSAPLAAGDQEGTETADVAADATENDEPATEPAPEPDAVRTAADDSEKPDRPTPVQDALKRVEKNVKRLSEKARDAAEKAVKHSTKKPAGSADKTDTTDKADKPVTAKTSVGADNGGGGDD